MLIHANFNKDLYLHCDASNKNIGYALTQEIDG